MHLPPPLPIDRAPVVRIVAPSGLLQPHVQRLEEGIKTLEDAGFAVSMDRHLTHRNHRGYLAGSDIQRYTEFVQAIMDPEVDIVWWARGGSGGARLHADIINTLSGLSPKWLIGFSDATSLLNAISLSLGWVTIHGPTVTFLPKQPECLSKLRLLTRQLVDSSGESTLGVLPIYGGNITVLASMMGCIDLSRLGRHRLLLEDVGECPYRLDRSLTQLRGAWPVDRIEEVLLGDLDLGPEDSDRIAEYIQVDFNCPVRRGIEAGHRGYLSFIPLGHSKPTSCS